MPLLLIPAGHAAPVALVFPTLVVEMQFTSAVWTDITQYVDTANGGQITITRGSSRVESPVIRYDAGTCTIPLLNTDRRFDPTNLAGPYVSGGVTQVQPMVPVRVSAVYASVTYRLFNGTVDAWTLSYAQPSDADTAITCTDGFKQLGQPIRAGRSVYKGPGEDSGARVTRILDDAGWPGSKRTISQGDATLQATLLGFNAALVTPSFQSGTPAAVGVGVHIEAPAGTPLDELYLTSDTEMGEMYIDGNGFVVFRNRNALYTDTRSTTSQATFGDDPAVPTTELPYANVTPAYDHATLYTAATIANIGGTLQTALDPVASQPFPAGYGIVTFDSENLIADTDWQALGYAQWVVATSSSPELRFADMTIDPLNDPADLYPQILGRRIGDRITIKRRPPGGGAVITRDAWIRGMSYAFTDAVGSCTWILQDATSAPQPTIWDTGNWDSGIWGF